MFSVTRTVAPPTMLIDRRTVLLPSSRERDSVFVPSPGKKKEERKKKNSIVRATFETKKKKKKRKKTSSSRCKAFKKTKFQIWTVFLISSIPGVPSRRDKERDRDRERDVLGETRMQVAIVDTWISISVQSCDA